MKIIPPASNRDEVGWTIHRKRAWMSVLSGAHYDYIDFSITVGSEAGTPASQRGIRKWMKHLSEFIHNFDFVHARPLPDWIKSKPEELVARLWQLPAKITPPIWLTAMKSAITMLEIVSKVRSRLYCQQATTKSVCIRPSTAPRHPPFAGKGTAW
jgi:hypothetical protein